MRRIENLNKWMKGKTVERIDDSAANVIDMFFTDGTAVMLETEHTGCGIYGCIAYEIDPTRPSFLQKETDEPCNNIKVDDQRELQTEHFYEATEALNLLEKVLHLKSSKIKVLEDIIVTRKELTAYVENSPNRFPLIARLGKLGDELKVIDKELNNYESPDSD